jgi:threonine/homoserine/homoserine lactone efflux protein
MESYKRRHQKKTPNFRSFLDYFMAGLMAFFGIFIIFSEKFLGYDYFEGSMLHSKASKIGVGIAFMLFGVFRAYSGYVRSRQTEDNES